MPRPGTRQISGEARHENCSAHGHEQDGVDLAAENPHRPPQPTGRAGADQGSLPSYRADAAALEGINTVADLCPLDPERLGYMRQAVFPLCAKAWPQATLLRRSKNERVQATGSPHTNVSF